MVDESAANEGTNTPHTGEPAGAPPTEGGAPVVPLNTHAAPAPALEVKPAVEMTPAEKRAAGGDIQQAMEKILANVQLPERRGAPGKAAAGETKQYDTSLEQNQGDGKKSAIPKGPASTTAEDHLATVHTLKQDLREVVRDQKISRVRAAALEVTKRHPEQLDTEITTRRSFPTGVVIAIIALLFLGVGSVFGVYFLSESRTPGSAAQAGDALVFAESTRVISLENKQPIALEQELAALRQSSGNALGSFMRIVPVFGVPAGANAPSSERLATVREFLLSIGARPPEELLRALAETFFVGTHTVDKNAPIIVIPVISYDRAFAGMLAWEATLNADLAPFFTPVPPLYADATGAVHTRTFTDEVMRNYDVRVLKDDSGVIQLYYSFPTRGMLIIAESPYSFPEAIARLQASRKL